MERIFVAEKHDVAKAIADVLGITSKKDGFYECGQDGVTWCAGHMLELCSPEDYDERFKKWSLDHLPIINVPWKYKVIQGRGKQLKIIKDLMIKAKTIVHAGDTDGEGQLLVDEILEFYRIEKPVKRVLINDNNERLVKRAIDNLRDNNEFFGLSQAALARSVGDQLYGFNMSRLYTLKAQQQGADGVFSVGRVQTPILGLVVNRDREIAAHKKHTYCVLQGFFQFDSLEFPAIYKTPESAPVDDKGRVTDKAFIEDVASACEGQLATITQAATKTKTDQPPLPYDLLELQADAFRKFGIKPDQALKLTQQLREKKLITYNRSDSRYLSDEQHQDAPIVLSAIAKSAPLLAGACGSANADIKSRCFNSDNVTAHHAIIPTEANYSVDSLTENERQLYLLIARQYVAQFWEPKVSEVTTIEIECAGHSFKATSTKIINPGWSRLYKNDQDNEEINQKAGDDEVSLNLTDLVSNQRGQCTSTLIDEKETTPPKHYTIATLLKDLKRVAKYVKDPEIAALLRAKDKDKKGESGGIGTPATRDTFIVKLQDRGYLAEKGKFLISTEVGQEFFDALPAFATQPDMTALWHGQQQEIEKGTLDTNSFINDLVRSVTEHVGEIKGGKLNIKAAEGVKCPNCSDGSLRRRKGAGKGFFWGCSGYPTCTTSSPDKRGLPDLKPKAKADVTDFECQECDSKLVRRVSTKKKKKTIWYGCSGFPKCKQTYFDNGGKPDYK